MQEGVVENKTTLFSFWDFTHDNWQVIQPKILPFSQVFFIHLEKPKNVHNTIKNDENSSYESKLPILQISSFHFTIYPHPLSLTKRLISQLTKSRKNWAKKTPCLHHLKYVQHHLKPIRGFDKLNHGGLIFG